VNAVRAEPEPHPSLVSADERRAAYRESALANRGDPQAWNRFVKSSWLSTADASRPALRAAR